MRRKIASHLYSRAGAFTGGVTLLGLTLLGVSLASWQSQNAEFFCLYFYLMLLATGLRFWRAMNVGSMPFHVLFVLVGVSRFSLPETLVLACTSSLLECAGEDRRRSRLAPMMFQVAVSALGMAAAYLAYHSPVVYYYRLNTSLTLILAASIFFIVRTPLLAGAASLEEGTHFTKTWQETYLRSYPYYMVGAAIAGMLVEPGPGLNWQGVLTVFPVLYLLRRSYRLQLARLQQEKDQAQQVARLHMQIVEALAVAAEAKDEITHDHLQRVQVYAMDLAEEMHLGKEEMESLRAASLLHDIGKLAVPDHILGKPGRLTTEEFEKVKTHTIVGAEILRHVDFPYPVARLVRAHHEKWNGKGYPDGISGQQIPLAARILTVADCLDALTSDRQYRPALSPQQALQWLEIGKGSGFDPLVIEALTRRFPFMLKKVRQLCARETRPAKLASSPNGAAPEAGYQRFRPARPTAPVNTPDPCRPPIGAVEQDILATLEIGADLRDSLSMSESLAVLAERLHSMVPYDSMALYVREKDRLVPRYVTGDNRRLLAALQIPTGEGLSGWVAEHNTPIVNGNPAVEPFSPSTLEWSNPLRSALAVPLEGPGGMLGVLSLYQVQEDGFTEEHLRLLRDLSPSVTASLEGMLRHGEQNPTVMMDYATGLPNARALMAQLHSELARSSRTDAPFSLVLLSARFPDKAESARHGDNHIQMLRLLAKALKNEGRQYDLLARWDSAGFAILVPGLSVESVRFKKEQLVDAARHAIGTVLDNGRVRFASGEASYPADGRDAETLLAVAERRILEDNGIKVSSGVLRWTPAIAS